MPRTKQTARTPEMIAQLKAQAQTEKQLSTLETPENQADSDAVQAPHKRKKKKAGVYVTYIRRISKGIAAQNNPKQGALSRSAAMVLDQIAQHFINKVSLEGYKTCSTTGNKGVQTLGAKQIETGISIFLRPGQLLDETLKNARKARSVYATSVSARKSNQKSRDKQRLVRKRL